MAEQDKPTPLQVFQQMLEAHGYRVVDGRLFGQPLAEILDLVGVALVRRALVRSLDPTHSGPLSEADLVAEVERLRAIYEAGADGR